MISLSQFIEVQKWKICPVQFFFSDFEDIVQPGAMAVVVLKKPAAALLGHLLCCLMTGDTSSVPNFQIQKLKH